MATWVSVQVVLPATGPVMINEPVVNNLRLILFMNFLFCSAWKLVSRSSAVTLSPARPVEAEASGQAALPVFPFRERIQANQSVHLSLPFWRNQVVGEGAGPTISGPAAPD